MEDDFLIPPQAAPDNLEDYGAAQMDDDQMDNMAPEFQVIAADQSGTHVSSFLYLNYLNKIQTVDIRVVPGPANDVMQLSDGLPVRSPAAVLQAIDAGKYERHLPSFEIFSIVFG